MKSHQVPHLGAGGLRCDLHEPITQAAEHRGDHHWGDRREGHEAVADHQRLPDPDQAAGRDRPEAVPRDARAHLHHQRAVRVSVSVAHGAAVARYEPDWKISLWTVK